MTAEVAFAGSCRDGRFQMTDSQVGMNDCQGPKRVSFLCIQAETHTCTLHSNKRFRLKVALHLTGHPLVLRGPMLSSILTHPPDRSAVQGEASVGVFYPFTQVEKGNTSRATVSLSADAAGTCWTSPMLPTECLQQSCSQGNR